MKITMKDLEATVSRINSILNTPQESYTKGEDGKYKSNIGCYHLDGAYGGWALYQIVNEGGGVKDIFGGHMPKRVIYGQMHAFLKGIELKEEATK